MEMLLTIASGIGWMIVYIECIRLGFKQKTYAMPFLALGLNLAWEMIYTISDIFLEAHGPLIGMNAIQVTVNALWVLLDCVILYTYFKYGTKKFEKILNRKFFVPWIVLVLICCFALQIGFILEFKFIMAAQYSAFLQNLLMSVMFINMFIKRGTMEGQSLTLAISKWIGTLAPTLLMGVIYFNPLILICGIFCTIFDVIYISLLINHKKENNKILEVLS